MRRKTKGAPWQLVLASMTTVLLVACGKAPAPERAELGATLPAGRMVEVRDTTIAAILDAPGTAEPMQRATMSTKLMGTVMAVLVREGEMVSTGQLLARIDARDLQAKRAQVQAGLAEAEAVQRDAATQAQRFRALYADSAATQAQLDAVETGLARADAGVRSAHAAAAELDATRAYAEVRAPFRGIVTKRFMDPGAFAAPGAPIVTVEDGSRLRISVMVAPSSATALRRGMRLAGTVERMPVEAIVEGVAPSSAGGVYTVNAIVENRRGVYPIGGAATLSVPQGSRSGLLVPVDAIVREGDLTGVRVQSGAGTELRWVRLGRPTGEMVEALSGLRNGDRVFVPASLEGRH